MTTQAPSQQSEDEDGVGFMARDDKSRYSTYIHASPVFLTPPFGMSSMYVCFCGLCSSEFCLNLAQT